MKWRLYDNVITPTDTDVEFIGTIIRLVGEECVIRYSMSRNKLKSPVWNRMEYYFTKECDLRFLNDINMIELTKKLDG